jgi:hypothetical protein
MFFHNTRYKAFKLYDGSPAPKGGILAASGLPEGQFLERFTGKRADEHPYLKRRFFDPQLYLSSLDADLAPEKVTRLATYPWFGETNIPRFDKALHGNMTKWMAKYGEALRKSWTREVPTGEMAIASATREAIKLQLRLGCSAIILPTPLIHDRTYGYDHAAQWLDGGLEACKHFKTVLPVFATVAIRDSLLHNIKTDKDPLLRSITDQISSREHLAGAYMLVETNDEDVYSCESLDTVRAIFRIIDDLTRGAGLRIVVNYLGTLGAVTTALGAEVWSTGYYLSQRRFKLSDFNKKPSGASQYPRYHSLQLGGDIGIQRDLAVVRSIGLLDQVLTPTPLSTSINNVLRSDLPVSAAGPGWDYAPQNIATAGAHYLTCMHRLGEAMIAFKSPDHVNNVEVWLERAACLAEAIRAAPIENARATEVRHQSVWLKAFREWREYASR